MYGANGSPQGAGGGRSGGGGRGLDAGAQNYVPSSFNQQHHNQRHHPGGYGNRGQSNRWANQSVQYQQQQMRHAQYNHQGYNHYAQQMRQQHHQARIQHQNYEYAHHQQQRVSNGGGYGGGGAPYGYEYNHLQQQAQGGGGYVDHHSAATIMYNRGYNGLQAPMTKDDRKAGRRAKQMRDKGEKTRGEIEYYWILRRRAVDNRMHVAARVNVHHANESKVFGSASSVGINFAKYNEIEVERTGNGTDVTPVLETFQDLAPQVPEFLTSNIAKMGYETPTPIQKHAVPLGLAGHDLMCCAQTGSGKTCAFLLPLIFAIANRKSNPLDIDRDTPSMPAALVLAPTRELAVQIEHEAKKLTYKSTIRTCVVYGGAKARPQLAELAIGVDICVATPGRLIDFMDRGCVSLSRCEFLILDEADRMLDMGFEPQIRGIVEERDMIPDRQTFMFSATFPDQIQRLAADFMKEYAYITVGRVGSTVEGIEQRLIMAPNDQHVKFDMLIELLDSVPGRTLVFVKRKSEASWVARRLGRDRGGAEAIHGDRTQQHREKALHLFRSGRIRVLVATDVAARGLDVAEITHVINFSLPDEFDSYVHRIGRTGRAGHKGIATSLYIPGFDKKNEDGKLAPDMLRLMVESKSNVPDWFVHLPENSMGIRTGGAAKKYHNRDVRRGGYRGRGRGGYRGRGRGGYRGRGRGGMPMMMMMPMP